MLGRILSQPFPYRDDLRQQVVSAHVTADCLDCPSIWLNVITSSADMARKEDGTPAIGIAPCELEGTDVDGMHISILLHLRAGYVSEIEVFRWDGKPVIQLADPGVYRLICNP